jgi:putative transposase
VCSGSRKPDHRFSYTGGPDEGHGIYPYLLRGVKVERPDRVWSADITYVPMATGFITWWR